MINPMLIHLNKSCFILLLKGLQPDILNNFFPDDSPGSIVKCP